MMNLKKVIQESFGRPTIKVSKRYLTLIELVITIALLLMFIGVVAINVTKALGEQKFRSEVDLVVDTLRMAQNLMLITPADVHVKVTEQDKGLNIRLQVDGNVSENWEKILNRTSHILTAIHSFQFGELQNFPQETGVLDIRFLSSGSLMSRGIIRLSNHLHERDICLPGYPRPIFSVEKDTDPDCGEADKSYDERLTIVTLEEINAHS